MGFQYVSGLNVTPYEFRPCYNDGGFNFHAIRDIAIHITDGSYVR